ncbi:hypothetical protein I4U23_011263 [Adineta vaga]|nr:hypothetical protein I4U23_011263 [Adineta vaga]
MSFELLPNEVLFDIFNLLSIPDFLHAFSELNHRFDKLICDHLQNQKCIDLRTTTKFNFDLLWKQYFPKLIGEITSLSLSNNINTFDQFYSHGFTLRQFTRLQSLSLFHIHSNEAIQNIMRDLPHLSTLTHMTLEKCTVNDYSFVDIIWSLPNLVYFRFNTFFDSPLTFNAPTVTSSTVKSVHGFCDERGISIIDLLQRTPKARYLSICINSYPSFTDLSTNLTSITKLNLVFLSSLFSALLNFLRRIPNLTHLKIDMKEHFIHAQIWERLIQKYLTKLKHLQFKMKSTTVIENSTAEQQVKRIVDDFRNSFWLDEHQWFVQCDWNPRNRNCYVYTIPYTFEDFNIDFPIYSKSTHAHDNAQCLFECVRRLTFDTTSYDLHECLTFSYIQLPNIEHISIKLPIQNPLWYTNGQCHPSVYKYELNCLNQLQHLLEQYSRLTSLHFQGWPSAILNLSKCHIKNMSVFELISRCPLGHEYYYTRKECDQFTSSILSNQCKILSIDVKDSFCVYDLIIKMNKLEMLNVNLKINLLNLNQTSDSENLVKWLNRKMQGVSTNIKNITTRTALHRSYLFIERS